MIEKIEYQPSYIAVANKTIYYNSEIYSCKMWLY